MKVARSQMGKCEKKTGGPPGTKREGQNDRNEVRTGGRERSADPKARNVERIGRSLSRTKRAETRLSTRAKSTHTVRTLKQTKEKKKEKGDEVGREIRRRQRDARKRKDKERHKRGQTLAGEKQEVDEENPG